MKVVWITGFRIAVSMAVLAGLVAITATPSSAHGQPVEGLESRNSFCTKTQSRPTLNKDNPACAKAYNGPEGDQPGYDPFESNQANGTVHTTNGVIGPLIKEVVPEGQLCGAGRAKYAGFNTPTSAWPYRKYEPGATLRYKYTAWAHHPGRIDLYVSKEGYDPTTKALGWSDLEPEPFDSLSTDQPNGRSEEHFSDTYEKDITLPNRTGRIVIAAIWARSDSPEVFYNCSDVVLEAGATGEVYNLGAVEGEVSDPIIPANNPEETPEEEENETLAEQTPVEAEEVGEPTTPIAETPEEETQAIGPLPENGGQEDDNPQQNTLLRDLFIIFLGVVTLFVILLKMRPSRRYEGNKSVIEYGASNHETQPA